MSSKFDMAKAITKNNAKEVTSEIIATASKEKKRPGRPTKDFDGVPFTLKIPTDLHHTAKIVAGVKGLTLTLLVTEALQFYLDNHPQEVDKAKKIIKIMGA